MATRQKRTPNQIEFDKQIARLKRIVKQIETDYGVSFQNITEIKPPKRITKRTIQELKSITAKALKEEAKNFGKPPKTEIKTTHRRKSAQADVKRGRNRYLEALLRNARRTRKTKPTEKINKPRTKTPKAEQPKTEQTPIKEQDAVIDTVYQLLYEWVFNIADAHEGYEDVKRADRDLVWAIIGRAINDLGEQQVALNIRNNSGEIEAIINRIIYGSDETTVRFDIAELSRIVNGRSLTIDESIYLTELFENRTFIEFDEEDIETSNPYFATLKGYDGEK